MEMDDSAAAAFELLWHQEYVRIVRTAFLMTGSREDAIDLAQEAFAIAWRKWRTVGGLERPGGWLQVTVGKLALNWLRRWRLRRSVGHEPESYVAEPEPTDPQLARALRSLPPAQRAVIVLRFYADQSVEEVARGLGKRPGTVRALTSQGIAALRRTLRESEEVRDVG
jgi:RNA polymerase sigma-70 factor (ECF subfamily)